MKQRREPLMRGAEVGLSAVLSQTRLAAGLLAGLGPGDQLEIEPSADAQPVVRLMVGTTTVAVASLRNEGGRLVARIERLGGNPADGKGETWRHRKKTAKPV